jgi:gluconate 2-dehydrogenase gamma chain
MPDAKAPADATRSSPIAKLPAEKLIVLGINRRQAIVRLAAAAAAGASAKAVAQPGDKAPAGPPEISVPGPSGHPKGSKDPRDPDLVNPELLWEKLLTAEERATAAALCGVIIPADDRSPSAAQLKVEDFVDEWVSAPYPLQKRDLQIVRGGLAWINTEAGKRFKRRFAELGDKQKIAICDDIADLEKARRPFKSGARFFDRMRFLTMLGFYTTLEGMKDLGYVGNVPSAEWKGPSREVLAHLKLL